VKRGGHSPRLAAGIFSGMPAVGINENDRFLSCETVFLGCDYIFSLNSCYSQQCFGQRLQRKYKKMYIKIPLNHEKFY
jgi:hypothetical protein